MSTSGEAGQRAYGNSLYHLGNFSGNLKLFVFKRDKHFIKLACKINATMNMQPQAFLGQSVNGSQKGEPLKYVAFRRLLTDLGFGLILLIHKVGGR